MKPASFGFGDVSAYNAIALRHFLEMAVPIEMQKIQRRGGITQTDLNRAESLLEEFDFCGRTDIVVGGYGGTAQERAQIGKTAGQLAGAIAIMLSASGEQAHTNQRIYERWLENLSKPR